MKAVEGGRRVYANVRKFVFYIFAHATPEVVPFLVWGADELWRTHRRNHR